MEFEISLKDVIFYAYHGVYEEEQKIGNEFRVNLSVSIPYVEGIETDDLSLTVSYADLYNLIKEEMDKPRKLLETVAVETAKRLMTEFKSVTGGNISIEKVHPPIPGMLGSAEVTLKF